jgi:putative ABC transport system permease protein
MRLYALLLHLYPTSFRHEYGADMAEMFGRRRRDASGPIARAALWAGALVDVASNAALVHADILKQDLRYTLRMLRRAPGFAITAVLVVALGIGATTAAFSVTDFVLIRPLPFPDAGRLLKLWERTPGYSRMELSPANYRDWKRASRSFSSIGTYSVATSMNLLGIGDPQRLEVSRVSADLMPTLGVQPLIGRTFADADDRPGAAGTIVISYHLWQSIFGGDAAVVGRPVVLDEQPYTVLGVMPPAFNFPTSTVDLWTPFRFDEQAYQDRNDNYIVALGRLRAGVSVTQARAELEVITAQLQQQYPKDNKDTAATVIRLQEDVSAQSRLLLEALAGAAFCVLLISCANLANLLLARALGRRKELAVRTAIGAGRERLARQLITESLLLACIGGALGVGVASAAVPLLARLVPTNLPAAGAPSVDLRVLLFAGVLTALTGVAFGMVPVWRAGGSKDLDGLREGARAGGGRKERLRSALVVAEIVTSIVLLIASGLLMRAMWRLQAIDPGFRVDHVLTMRTSFALPKYGATAKRAAFYDQVLADIRALPGVSNAAFTSFTPIVMGGGIWPVSVNGQPEARSEEHTASLRYITPGFFDTLGIPLREGRNLSESDTADRAFVAVVSESFVRQFLNGDAAIGRHFTFAFSDRTIVGVVANIRVRGLEIPSEPQVYLPYKQVADGSIIGYIPKDLLIHASLDAGALMPSVRAVIRRADPEMPVSNVRTMSAIVDGQTASRAVQLRVLGAFALIAFFLAAVGIHGLLSFAVSQRTQEIGVRIALGAQRSDILSMVVGQGALLAAAGVVPGVALAYVAGRMMEALLVGVRPADAVTFASVVGLAGVMTIAGCLMPTLRALRVSPITAIRQD